MRNEADLKIKSFCIFIQKQILLILSASHIDCAVFTI